MTTLAHNVPAWLGEFQRRARTLADSMAWPTKKDEEWRRTPMSRLSWDAASEVCRETPLSSAEADATYAGLILVDGGCAVRVWSSTPRIQIRHLTEADEALWQILPNTGEDRFLWENLASPEEAVVLEIEERTSLERPILIHYLFDADSPTRRQPKLVVRAKAGSQAEVLLKIDSRGPIFLNSLKTLWIGEGATLRFTEIQTLSPQSWWVDHSYASQERQSAFHFSHIDLGAATAKTKFCASIVGDHAELQARGIYVCRDQQHKDIRLVQRHDAPESLSNALFKGAVRDRGRSVFQGLIEVTARGHKTDAYLSNRNLVLNDGARADSLPQLKIDHNDLRCTHGSTTGMVDPEQVHYLSSRGLAPSEAKVLIALGLFQEILDLLPQPIRLPVEGQLESLLRD